MTTKTNCSDCCNATVTVDGDDREGTRYYVCGKCNKSCNIAVAATKTSEEELEKARRKVLAIIDEERSRFKVSVAVAEYIAQNYRPITAIKEAIPKKRNLPEDKRWGSSILEWHRGYQKAMDDIRAALRLDEGDEK